MFKKQRLILGLHLDFTGNGSTWFYRLIHFHPSMSGSPAAALARWRLSGRKHKPIVEGCPSCTGVHNCYGAVWMAKATIWKKPNKAYIKSSCHTAANQNIQKHTVTCCLSCLYRICRQWILLQYLDSSYLLSLCMLLLRRLLTQDHPGQPHKLRKKVLSCSPDSWIRQAEGQHALAMVVSTVAQIYACKLGFQQYWSTNWDCHFQIRREWESKKWMKAATSCVYKR